MNRSMLPFVRWLLLAALLSGVVFAQSDDAYLERYGLAIDNLQRSVAALPSDAGLAREELDRAFSALLTLSREAAAGPLAGALERVVERARTAIGNASQDDLAVQAAVLEGGFQRLVYDAALRDAIDGQLDLARGRLGRVAADLGMPEADREALAAPVEHAAELRYRFEAGVAEVIDARLETAQEFVRSDLGSAYRALASGYGAFLLLQDSPRAPGTLNERFVETAQALVDGRAEEASAELSLLREQIGEVGEAARARHAGPAAEVVEAAVTPGELPAVPVEAEAPGVPADQPAVDTPTVAEMPAVAEAEPTAAEMAAEAEPVLMSQADLAAFRLEVEADLRQARLEPLERDLAAAGVDLPQRQALAETLLDAGFARLSQVGDAVAAPVADALAAAQRGDEPAAKRALSQASERYDALLSNVVRARFAMLDADTSSLLRQLISEPGLRTSDVAVAAGQVDTARRALAGTAESPLFTGARQTMQIWSGLPRAIVLVALGLLALIPLALSNLAFGGGNRNWQLVGIALFLLLLPALFEGLVGLSVLLVEFAQIDVLRTLAALSPFSGTMGHAAWTAISVLAVIFAIGGLYGICAQFGLIGRRRPRSKATSVTTTRTATRTAARAGATSESIDWDED